MRYLNKICFINSAATKYTELDLNGNVHFIGTQGVGKSTLLRAILFFYNANSLKLGVPTGPTSKSFAEWYFPYQNSYIVYEVQRETGAYTILAFKAQNRVCFYFIDAPYRREMFIDADGRAFETWDKIRRELDSNNIFYSRRIKSFEEYRDIIYGNDQGKKEFKRYALLESRQYLNIPRTIQNVFLNSKLEAEFIKQTIIDSMGEDELHIDLRIYAHHLQDFEAQLNDIRQFRQPAVQKQAQKAAQLYIAITHLQRQQRQQVDTLRVALAVLEEQEPQLREKVAVDEEAKQRLRDNIASEDASFKRRNDKFVAELTLLNDKLKTARQKQQHYANLNIKAMLQRVDNRISLTQNRDNLATEKNLLSGEFQEVSQKYAALLAELENQKQRFANRQEQEKLRVKEQFYRQRDEIGAQYEELQSAIRQQHQHEVDSAREDAQELTHQRYQHEKELALVKQQPLYAGEVAQQKEQLHILERQLQQATLQREANYSRLEEMKRSSELEDAALQETHQRKVEQQQQQIEQLQQQIEAIEKKLESDQTALYGWLNQNQPGWEENIGKVCAEELLFDETLAPRKLLSGNDGCYGIALSLSNRSQKVKSLDDYRQELERVEQELEKGKSTVNRLTQELENSLEKVKQRFHPKARELRKANRELDYQIEHHPRQVEEAQLKLNQLQQQAGEERQQRVERLQVELAELTENELAAQQQLEKLEGQLNRQLKTKQRQRQLKVAEQEQLCQRELEQIDVAVAKETGSYQQRKTKVVVDRDSELQSRGVDTGRLHTIEQELVRIDLELEFIEKNRDLVVEYRRDKTDFLDRVKEFKNEQQLVQRQQQQQQQQFDRQRQQRRQQLAELEGQIDILQQELQQIAADRKAFADFQFSEVYLQVKELFDGELPEGDSAESCTTLVATIKENFYTTLQRQNDLKEGVDKFLGHFSADNVFKFATRFSSLAGYLDFSQDLTEFIEADKIGEFERRINERFAEIVTGLGKETTDLVSRTGDIQKVIGKINRDFSARNFVGAIDKIELKLDASANNVFVVLQQIKEFNDQHDHDIGSRNLFSSTNHEENNQKAVELLRLLLKEVENASRERITLADSFELKFRVKENQNDTGWVEKLSHVGSDGTDVLVKAMVNIMLLNVFKEGASKRFSDFRLHCMMDEIGKLHPNNVRGILKFANDRNIMLINGSPTENNALNYKHLFKVSKDEQRVTRITRILTNNRPL